MATRCLSEEDCHSALSQASWKEEQSLAEESERGRKE